MRAFLFASLLAVALASFGAVCGCQGEAGAPMQAPSSSAPPALSASPLAEAPLPRRPSRRHYLARAADHCEVYSVDRDEMSRAERTPCPQDLHVGERIRVAGKTCFREGEQGRAQPVVCPGILIQSAERALEARDGG